MAYSIQVEIAEQHKKVQSGKGSGDAIFASQVEAENVAKMFRKTLDDCTAKVVDVGDMPPPR